MTRDDRGIEMLDLNTLDMVIGGLGGNPKNMGLEAPKDAFAPRVGAVYASTTRPSCAAATA